MQHQLGRVDLVAWQDRRIRDVQRPKSLAAALTATVGTSALLLLLRFVLGVELPLGLLQIAFAVLVAAGALLLMGAAVKLILRLQKR